MNSNVPKVRYITQEEAEKINKNNVAYFTLTDGTVAIVKKDEQKQQEVNKDNNQKKEEYSVYQKYKKYKQKNDDIQPKNDLNSVYKIKYSNQNNNIYSNNYEKNGYQIIEAIPVKFCQNPQIKNYSEPEPLYVQPYLNPGIIFSENESNNNGEYYSMNNNFINNKNIGFNQRKKY